MLPVLQYLGSHGEAKTSEIIDALGQQLQLTPNELAELLPSKRQRKFHNRIAWSLTYLKQAGLVAQSGRSTYAITNVGEGVLERPPERITIAFLMNFPSFVAFRNRVKSTSETEVTAIEVDPAPAEVIETPDEAIAKRKAEVDAALINEIQDRLQNMDSYLFEQVVLDVLTALGYGELHGEPVTPTPRSKDEGIDGIINEDPLGLEAVCVQAKRWSGSVGRKEIQAFVGAIIGQNATKGVFITTSDFTREAKEYTAKTKQPRVALINGEELARLMMKHDIGVTTYATHILKRIDSDYFVS